MTDSASRFAMLFDTAFGQLLVFLDETDEGDPAITVIGADVRGVRARARLSGWPDGEDGQLRNFAKTDQAMAEDFAAQLHRTADELAPSDSDRSPEGMETENTGSTEGKSAGRRHRPRTSTESTT